MTLLIRVATHADLPEMLAIRLRAFRRHAPSSYSAVEVENLLGDVNQEELKLMISESKIFVAEIDSKIVALAGWLGPHIRHVYVDPVAERRGLGSKILQAAEADYKSRNNVSEVQAGITLYARSFYEANGYRILSEEIAWDGSKYYMAVKAL